MSQGGRHAIVGAQGEARSDGEGRSGPMCQPLRKLGGVVTGILAIRLGSLISFRASACCDFYGVPSGADIATMASLPYVLLTI